MNPWQHSSWRIVALTACLLTACATSPKNTTIERLTCGTPPRVNTDSIAILPVDARVDIRSLFYDCDPELSDRPCHDETATADAIQNLTTVLSEYLQTQGRTRVILLSPNQLIVYLDDLDPSVWWLAGDTGLPCGKTLNGITSSVEAESLVFVRARAWNSSAGMQSAIGAGIALSVLSGAIGGAMVDYAMMSKEDLDRRTEMRMAETLKKSHLMIGTADAGTRRITWVTTLLPGDFSNRDDVERMVRQAFNKK